MIKIIKKKPVAELGKEELTKKIISKFRQREEEEETSVFAASINFPYLDTNLIPISNDNLKLLTEQESKENNLVIIQKVSKVVSVITTDPTQEKTKKFLEKLASEKGWTFKIFVVSRSNMNIVQSRYKKIVFVEILDLMSLHLSAEELTKFEDEMKDLLTLKQRISEMPVTQILNIIMAGAYKLHASDVHLEPAEKEFRLRYRIDGVLQDVAMLPLNVYKSIITRIKYMCHMKINLRDIAQDGTFEFTIPLSEEKEKKADTRVSIIPGNFGESAVIRLLDPESIRVTIDQLGLQGLAHEIIQREIQAPNGMILNTGPTGSGKTTTLYAIINKLNEPDKKIITIEDPIEYELSGISQTQIEKSRGYTFATGLRAIVRQDPDIILIGEIRDDETADIAVNSSLTGHLVLSSLHTNNAIGAIPRLIELGVKPSLMAPAINAVIGQRLVRKLCECKEAYAAATESIESIKRILSIISPKSKVEIPKNIKNLYRPKGCPKCNGIGYKGRIGIFEVLTISEEIEKLILELAGETELTMAALEYGMITMLQDGIIKAVSGITSIDEVRRVTGQGEFLENIYEKLMAATLGRSVMVSKQNFELAEKNIKDFKKFQELISREKSTDIVKIIFAAASILGVNDIHIEPQAAVAKIRFRIDGILQDVATVPLNEYPAFLGEIKMLSGVKTEARQGVIDSRFTIKFNEEIKNVREPATDVRVSIILGGYGETVVLRLLFKTTLEYDLTKLGIRQQNLEKIMHEIEKPNGVILNTGPTGSGKTTTLYSILQHLNKPEVKIITVEDPIEYQMEG
ncbi:MAG TPA: ATPase, T2SS/T4P/T4SS family, partial [Patescibacteria group bacterium]|nr:ATPase, T2SS/T4P/T4SS family [Patescibacteria group bacterium]